MACWPGVCRLNLSGVGQRTDELLHALAACPRVEHLAICGNPFVRGKPVVMFDVEFPKTLAPDVAARLRPLLPTKREKQLAHHDAYELGPDIELAQLEREQASHGHAYDSDGEDGTRGGAPPGVQCAQQ